MHYLHITRQLMRAIAKGKRDPGDLSMIAMSHLFQLCETCRAEFDSWVQEGKEAGSSMGYGAMVERVMREAETMAEEVADERHQAEPRLEALLALPASERLAAIQAEPNEYQGPAIGELLIEASLAQMPGHPRQALALGELAMAVLHHSELSSYGVELYARATAHVANALRVGGRLQESSLLFDNARYLLRGEGGGDGATRSELDSLEGSLRRDQRRFSEAEALLRRAVLAYRGGEADPIKAARTLITLGSLYREQGKPAQAVRAAEDALELLDSEQEPHLHFYAHHNRTHALCTQGRYPEARAAMSENATLYQRYMDPLSQLRVAWLEGKIARGLGETEVAESHFLVARYGFLKHEIAFDAALVSLELADLYLEVGRTGEVGALAGEMVEVFTRLEVHREATTALLLFSEAAQLERVTAKQVADLSTYLTRARRDPTMAFQGDS